jgi:putative ABC transport system permease protein
MLASTVSVNAAAEQLAAVVPPDYSISWTARLPFALRTVLRRWRSLIAMVIGVSIGLGIGMTMLGIARGNMELLIGQFQRSSANLYIVAQGGKLIPTLPGESVGTIKQARHVVDQIGAWPDVQGVFGVMGGSLERQTEGRRRSDAPAQAISITAVYGDPQPIPGALAISQGAWFRRPGEIVLGTRLAEQLRLSVGDVIRLSDRDFTVSGIGNLRGSSMQPDSVIYMDGVAFQQRADVGDLLSVIVVYASDPQSVQHRLDLLGGLSTTSQADVVQQMNQLYAPNLTIYWALIFLTLTIAGLFVATMLNHSVSERRLEFATLRAIGLPSRSILATVAVEALVISSAAGLLAVGFAQLFGKWIDWVVARPLGLDTFVSYDLGMFGVVVLLALGLGLLAGLVPARRATRVDPVEVLREA